MIKEYKENTFYYLINSIQVWSDSLRERDKRSETETISFLVSSLGEGKRYKTAQSQKVRCPKLGPAKGFLCPYLSLFQYLLHIDWTNIIRFKTPIVFGLDVINCVIYST